MKQVRLRAPKEVAVPDIRIENHLKTRRRELGWSQGTLADRTGVSRQTIAAVEAGRNIPSTELGLRFARALECSVEDLFRLVPEVALDVRLAGTGGDGPDGNDGAGVAAAADRPRVVLGKVGGRWVAHVLPPGGTSAADGVVVSKGTGGTAVVQPWMAPKRLARNVLVAGCAPILGAVADRVERRFGDARVRWLPADSRNALDLLAEGLVHVAGLHLAVDGAEADNALEARRAIPNEELLLVNLTTWRQGLVVPPGNPLGIRNSEDLLRPGLRFARRAEGSGAYSLAERMLREAGACGGPSDALAGPLAASHGDVARMVLWGSANTGIAIESVALEHGLEFVPLAEEHFDLVLPARTASAPPVSRLLSALEDPGFRTEVSHLPGYDSSLSGQVTKVMAG